MVYGIKSEIKAIPACGSRDERDALDIINMIKRANIDLTLLGLEPEISNSTVVSMTEQRMPREIKKEWVEMLSGEHREGITKNKIRSRLDKRYSDQGKLVDAIMSQIEGIPACDSGDEQGMLDMINIPVTREIFCIGHAQIGETNRIEPQNIFRSAYT